MIFVEVEPVQVITLLVAVIFPVLVGLVTTRVTEPGRKAMFLAGLTVLAGLGSELTAALTNQTPYNLGAALLTAFGAFIVAVAMHYGLWKPTGVAGRAQAAFSGEDYEEDYAGRHRMQD